MKKVLFVCVENAARSQMAEAFLNKLSSGKMAATSAGVKPAKEVNPMAIEDMREIGIDMSKQKPKMLTAEMVKAADKVITMGCGADVCPAPPVESEGWGIRDPSGKSIETFREVRDEIKKRVEKLIKEIS
jgi:arsenate reductase